MKILRTILVFQIIEEPGFEEHKFFKGKIIDSEVWVDGLDIFMGREDGVELGNY
jgi:hypothetical protein